MKKIITYAIVLIVLIILILIIISLLNPLRKSEIEIKKDIIQIVPIATDINDVIKIIKNNKEWDIRFIDYKSGYSIDKLGNYDIDGKIFIGTKSIKVHLGEYRNIFVTDVLAYFGFDENSNLIDTTVIKETDSL